MPFFEALGGLALDSGIFDAGASITAAMPLVPGKGARPVSRRNSVQPNE